MSMPCSRPTSRGVVKVVMDVIDCSSSIFASRAPSYKLTVPARTLREDLLSTL